MGVDISTYRGRIGCFSYQQGSDVVMFTLVVNFSKMMKYVGSVTFICLLLILAGIEQNPGPPPIEKAIYERALNKALPKLVGNLSLDSVLDYLLAEEILTRIQARDIKKMETSSGIRALICFIRSRGESVYTRFKKSLRETYQHGLLEYLEKIENRLKKQKMKGVSYRKGDFCEGSEPSQEKEDSDDCLEAYGANVFERALNKSMPKLVENLNLENVLDNLRAEKVLTTIQARDIKEEKNTSSRVRELIDVISTRGESAYISLKKGLRETHQHGLAEYLEEIEKKLKEQEIKGLSNSKGYFRKGSEPSQEKDTDGQAKSNAGFIPRTGNISISEDNDDSFEADDTYFDCFESYESDVDSDTFFDAPGYQETIHTRRDADIERILAKLGLSGKLECKIKISDVVQVDIPETGHKETTARDIPFIFLKRLLSGNSDVMNYKLFQGTRTFGCKSSMNSIFSQEEGDYISPLDMFLLVYHCCDPMLKQVLYQKLSLAKLALPFLYQEYPSSKKVLSVWPLRFLLTETMYETDSGSEIREIELLDLPAYVVSVVRFGRPRFSKSKLLNVMLCESSSETFFHKDRPLGMTPRYAACGYVEMFYVPFLANGNSQFNKPMIFLNARGDFHRHFNVSDRDFITRTSDTVVVIFDSDTLFNNSLALEKHICRFSSVVVIFVISLGLGREGEIFTKLKQFKKLVVNRYNLKLHVLVTNTDTRKKNSSEILSETKDAICKYLRNKEQKLESLRTRILQPFIDTDETDSCKKAHEFACSIVKSIEQLPKTGNLVELVTPVQSFNSKHLGQLLMESHRNYDPSTVDNVKAKISVARQLKSSQITQTVKLFYECLIENRNDQSFLQFYMLWIKLFLDQKKRMYIKAKVFTYDDKMSDEDQQESNNDKSLQIEHLLREVGHICDSILCSDVQSENKGFPSVTKLGEVFASLVLNGQTLELLDGDNFLIPTEWIKLVLGRVHEKIEKKQLRTLSILGVKNSGKSTLLNTMFGLQFPASSGRCTRGIHMQLIPISKQSKNKSIKMPFEYILILDTEGIRTPELLGLQETNYRRDNELSTIITGLGDHTILNVMGEYIIEMHEILQIPVHSFLRLKLANDHFDIHQSCYLEHQNASNILAPIKLKNRLKQTVKVLNNVVKAVANYEGISNTVTFNEVIEFNPETDVWYMPNLWQGNSPMATINRKYCERVSEMTACLLQKSFSETEKSFKSLNDFVLHMEDLWNGVLAEHFVISFRNIIETKAYNELERKLKEELWKLESLFAGRLSYEAQKHFSDCDNHKTLCISRQEIPLMMHNILSSLKLDAESNLDKFFKDNNYKDTTIKWKNQSKNRLQIFCKGLIDNSNIEINSLFRKREVDIMINKCKKHEEELRRKSLELAEELRTKERVVTQNEKDLKFDHIWSKFVEESLSADTDVLSAVPTLRTDYIECLASIFESHINLLIPFLKSNQLHRDLKINSLYGSFDKTGITEEDICITKSKSILYKLRDKIKYPEVSKEFGMACEATENLFKTIDANIMHISQKDDLIASRDVKQLLEYVESELKNDNKNNHHYTITITFKFKVLVHVSTFSLHRFAIVNQRGINGRLRTYRKQMQERFYAHLKERPTEETAAFLMHRVIEDYIREKVAETLSWKLKLALKNMLPETKLQLILGMLIEFVKENEFKQFLSYILNPKGCAYIWITKEAKTCLFSTHFQIYYRINESEVLKYFEDIKSSLYQSCKSISEEFSPSIEEWIEGFRTNCKTLTFPKASFRNVVRELKDTERVHITEFRNKILEKIEQSYESLLEDSKSVTHDTVRWTGNNPIDTLFEDIWGCPEQCLFCGEPCFRSDKHDVTTHNCVQHRPLGCCGGFDEKTGEILLQSCNLNVASDAAAPCSIINFKCNEEMEELVH